ncbi:MAG: GNAT family N-acetyltransferase [Bdellovibrionales bacterium]|nr:GNAT family N-acetyltransferase [Bdellovibrionales bacterium]
MLVFKTAKVSQSQVIADLVNSAYRGDSSKAGWTTEADILGGQRTDAVGIEEMIRNPKSRIELMFEGEDLLGCVYLEHKDSITAYLGMLTVNPRLQAQGYGSRMLTHCESIARSWGCGYLVMDVIPLRRELIEFYERKGYLITGEEKPFPEHDPHFGLPKVSGLKLIELKKGL